MGAASLASLARQGGISVLASLHILPYTHSSLHSAYVRSHRCALARFARSGSELLDPSSVTHSALYTFIVTPPTLKKGRIIHLKNNSGVSIVQMGLSIYSVTDLMWHTSSNL